MQEALQVLPMKAFGKNCLTSKKNVPDMKDGLIYFLVNSNTPVNLTDKEPIRIFGSTQGFRNKINATYKRVNWHKENGNCTVICGGGC